MTISPSRRQFARAALWTAPVVLATATVPAYAASACQDITVHGAAVVDSVGETVHVVTFTAPRPWGEAVLEVTVGQLLEEPETVSHLRELTVRVRGSEPTVTLTPYACPPSIYRAHEEEVNS